MKKMFVLCLLFVLLTSCSDNRLNPVKETNKLKFTTSSQIVFPDDYIPVLFTTKETWSSGYGIPIKQEYVFICRKKYTELYFFCTPEIEAMETTNDKS